ncbi:MAG: aspartate 1-decarboxylase [Candidatus Aminicenantes bacterium]|nr:MAG: aspartate 1-decarboxylase [Candidatus Aminicenantes bacterium]
MKRVMLKAKIHKATVTETNIDYEGSLTLDENLMRAADLIPYEQVHVYNISNGERFITYLIRGKKDSGIVVLNGAAAHKAKSGDKLIIASYTLMEDEDIDFFVPKILIIDGRNKIKKIQ